MSVQTSRKTTTTSYRTVNVASPEPPVATASRTVISSGQVSPLPYSVNGSYETVRYLVPMQQPVQQQSYVLMQQPMVQPMVQQMVSPMYLQTVPHLSVSSHESDLMYQQRSASVSGMSSVFSQSSSPIKSPEPSVEDEVEEEEDEEEEESVEVEETEIVNIVRQNPPPAIGKISRTEVRTELRDVPQPAKMDTRYFGELLAEVYRKNCDIHSCISENVSKIQGSKRLDTKDYKVERDEVESLIPKGATELTKQQIRYLLQTRLTADKSMRLLLSTFNSLREELLHMSEDLRRLEGEKESLERDLSFKADQARQYDGLLEAVRENNRQLQLSLKETTSAQRTLESQLMSSRSDDSSREFRLKELEGRIRTLEKENEMLRQRNAGQASSSALHIKTEELSRQYQDQLSTMREEKDQEIQRLRSQITKITTEIHTSKSSTSSSEKSLQLKIAELLASLDQRQSTITRQEEEIRRLMSERNSSSSNNQSVTKTVITKRYRNQYPILGLLSDDYQTSSPISEARTVTIESSGGSIRKA